jgi:hypothetical protein
MARQPMKQRRARHGKWRLAALGVVLLMAASVAAFWWRADSQETSSGTPRLVVDRTDVDLGYRRFGRRARVVFALTNAGDGVLRVKEVPRVIVKAGC